MKVHVRCRCGPSNEISIVVTDQRKGLTSETLRRRPDVGARWQTWARHPANESVYGRAHFERGGSEVLMRKRARHKSLP